MAFNPYLLIQEFAPLRLTIDRIGPFQERLEVFDFSDSRGNPANYYLLLSSNGRGKTHVLEMMAAMMGMLSGQLPTGFEPFLSGLGRAQWDVRISYSVHGTSKTAVLSFFAGYAEGEVWLKPWLDTELFEVGAEDWHRCGFWRNSVGSWHPIIDSWSSDLQAWVRDRMGQGLEVFLDSPLTAPTLIYFPAYRNIERIPENEQRAIAKPNDWDYSPAHVFREEGRAWKASLDNLLIWLKWLDDGRYDAAQELVNEFVFAGTDKRIDGIRKESLEAIIDNAGSKHRLDQLSSGEKSLVQIFLRLGAHMTANTVLLIDELDAHLHTTWCSRIAMQLKRLAKEHPGLTVIMATHSEDVMDVLAIEVEEDGLRKNGTLIETATEEEKARAIQEEAREMYGKINDKGEENGQPS